VELAPPVRLLTLTKGALHFLHAGSAVRVRSSRLKSPDEDAWACLGVGTFQVPTESILCLWGIPVSTVLTVADAMARLGNLRGPPRLLSSAATVPIGADSTTGTLAGCLRTAATHPTKEAVHRPLAVRPTDGSETNHQPPPVVDFDPGGGIPPAPVTIHGALQYATGRYASQKSPAQTVRWSEVE
jgi:hypothetical protein